MPDSSPGQDLAKLTGAFNEFLQTRLTAEIQALAVPEVTEPVLYCLDSPGKRIRPVLCLAAAGQLSRNSIPVAFMYVAAALECIHTYSLIHDDLPAMDNDALRRGRPTAHMAFCEWQAILAGDALNTLAFELLGRATQLKPEISLPELIMALAHASGMGGMIGGQALDLSYEKDPPKIQNQAQKKVLLEKIHLYKTAALMRTACEMGALVAGKTSKQVQIMCSYGEGLGMLFQISDDLLDVSGDMQRMGKAVGKDAVMGKLTYPGLFGLDESLAIAKRLTHDLKNLSLQMDLDTHGHEFFLNLPDYIAHRDH